MWRYFPDMQAVGGSFKGGEAFLYLHILLKCLQEALAAFAAALKVAPKPCIADRTASVLNVHINQLQVAMGGIHDDC